MLGRAEAHGINLWVINMSMERRIKKRAGCGTQMTHGPEANSCRVTPGLKNRFDAEHFERWSCGQMKSLPN